MKKIVFWVVGFCVLVGVWFVHGEVYRDVAQKVDSITFSIGSGESVGALATRLEQEQIIRSEFFFRQYLKFKKLDRNVRAGNFTVEAPITLARVAAVLAQPSQDEREITIIPGWTLHDIAAYLEEQEIASTKEVFALVGTPASIETQITFDTDSQPAIFDEIPAGISLEGYIRPDTFRIFSNASLEDIFLKLVRARDAEFTDDMRAAITMSGRSVHEVMTVASLLEKEVRSPEDKKIVADIFWRRYDNGWPMQADSSVHYIHGLNDSVFTTQAMRNSLNPYNTYEYPGLPPGPISTPDLTSIMAAIYPDSNTYVYFLTTLDTGEVKYASTLDGHNANVQKYLR